MPLLLPGICTARTVPRVQLQDGQLRWSRLENLLREGSKSSDFDAGQLWLLAAWLLGDNAASIRSTLATELARILDAAAAADARERIAQGYVLLLATNRHSLHVLPSQPHAPAALQDLSTPPHAHHVAPLMTHVCAVTPTTHSFNNRELAERLVPMQPNEEEALARGALLMSTLTARIAQSAAGESSSSGGVVASGASAMAQLPAGQAGTTQLALPPGRAAPAPLALPAGSGLFGTLTPGDVAPLLVQLQDTASASMPQLQQLAAQPGTAELLGEVGRQLSQRFAARVVKFALGGSRGGQARAAA